MNIHQVLFLTENSDTGASWFCGVSQSQKKYSVTVAHQRSISSQVVTTFDLIIVEVEATKPLSAIWLCQCLRSHTEVPILFLSSLNDEEYEIEAYQAGADDYILKPVSSDLMHAKLRAWQRWVVADPIWS
jgi:DNA-binding response OmpR family regulator